jgi:hypothetical protein
MSSSVGLVTDSLGKSSTMSQKRNPISSELMLAASRRTAPVGNFRDKATMFFVRVSGARGNMAATRDALSLRCLSRDDPTVLSPVHGAAP